MSEASGSPGTYVADSFVPKVTLKLRKGWDVNLNSAGAVEVGPSQNAAVTVHGPDALVMPSGAHKEVPGTVERTAMALSEITGGKPHEAEGLGPSAVRLDVEVTKDVAIFSLGTQTFVLEKGFKYRFFVIDASEVVIVSIEAPRAQFDDFVGVATQVVNSLRFG